MLISSQVWPAAAARIYPNLNLDWANQDPSTKPVLHARVSGRLVVIEGALTKPTDVTTAGRVIATFSNPIVLPKKVHSTGVFETYQAGNGRREWRYQIYPSGELRASGDVDTNSNVTQAYLHMVYYTDND